MESEVGMDHTNFDDEHLEDYSLGIQSTERDTQRDRNMFSVPTSPTMKRKQKIHQSVDSQLLSKHLKQASDVLQSLVKKPNLQQNQKVDDGPALYGQLLADKLRQLSPRNRLLLENKIDNLVFEAQFQELDSVTQSNFPRIITYNTISSPSSSQGSCVSIESTSTQQNEGISHTSKNARSTYSSHQLSHSPSPCESSPGAYSMPSSANQVYIQPPLILPSQPQQYETISHKSKEADYTSEYPIVTQKPLGLLEFYSNAEGYVDLLKK